MQAHANDLLPVLKESSTESHKSFITIVGDNGPDMNPSGYINTFYFGRLWRDTGVTKLSCVTYPAGRSAFNPIEHAWSPLSNCLTSVKLAATLKDEDLPLCKQSGLTSEERSNKNAKMLDEAANQLVHHWENITYDGHAVVPMTVPSNNTSRSYCDHQRVEKCVHANVKALREDPDLLPLVREFQFLCLHADRRRNSISFVKCQLFRPGRECNWCLSHPPVDCPAYQFEKSIGGFCFDPMPSEDHPNHYMTYLEMVDRKKYDYQHDLFGIGKCSICPNWWFSSATEMKRHKKMVHPRVPINEIQVRSGDEDAPTEKTHICKFGNCDLSFSTYHQLLTHKNKSGHKRDRKRKALEANEKRTKAAKKVQQERGNLHRFFLAKPPTKEVVIDENVNDGNSEDEEDVCDAKDRCKIQNNVDDNELQWVQCERCDAWWHTFCAGLDKVPDVFKCENCLY